jgi:hypothetical protein
VGFRLSAQPVSGWHDLSLADRVYYILVVKQIQAAQKLGRVASTIRWKPQKLI